MLDLKYRINRKIENATIWIARHLPQPIRRWVVVMAAVKACKDTGNPDNLTYKDMHDAA